MAPSMLKKAPVQTLQFIITFQSHLPKPQEDPGGGPFLKAQMGRRAGANARGVQRLPLATGAQHVEDTVGAGPVWNPGPSSAQRVGIHPLGNQWGQHLPQGVGYLKGTSGGVGWPGWACAAGPG